MCVIRSRIHQLFMYDCWAITLLLLLDLPLNDVADQNTVSVKLLFLMFKINVYEILE